MTSLNLSSLTTFWQSVKTFLFNTFSDKTVLWEGNSPSTDVTLSETIDNFERVLVEYKINENYTEKAKFYCTIVPSLCTSKYVTFFAPFIDTSYNSRFWFTAYDISTRNKFTVFRTGSADIQSQYSNPSVSFAFINYHLELTKITGLKRVANN